MPLTLVVIALWTCNNLLTEAAQDDGPRVQVSGGTLRGLEKEAVSGSRYYSFEGIPYARAPIGDLRFKDPEPAEPWSGILNATSPGPACPQLSAATSEDCLSLNVHTPQLEGSRPVMVWIHGGGYMMDTGNNYRPDFLLEQGVILVTINYRLGALGFLCWSDQALPSNLGLKDQAMALRWIHDNIAAFGGDPTKVTIFGESAGGASVILHMLSPLSKGLFQRAIAMSGTALSPWAISSNARERGRRFVKALGLLEDEQNPAKVAHFLRTVDADQLVSKAREALSPEEADQPLSIPFAPCVDGSVLPDSPEHLLSTGSFHHVPLMAGVTSNEAKLLLVAAGLSGNQEKLKMLDEHFSGIFGPYLRNGDQEKQKIAAQEMKNFYFGNQEISNQLINNISQMMSDIFFVEPTEKTLRAVSAKSSSPSYLYLFSHEGRLSFTPPALRYHGDPPVPGVGHMDELAYVFPGFERDMSPEDDRVRVYMTRMLANFANFGNPVPEKNELLHEDWVPFTADERAYINISLSLKLQRNLFEGRISFLKQLLPALSDK